MFLYEGRFSDQCQFSEIFNFSFVAKIVDQLISYIYLVDETDVSTCTGSESFRDMHIDCSPGGISVAICESAFTNAGMSVSEIGLQDSSNSSCHPMIGNSTVEFLIPASGDCGTAVENNGTHMVYSNTISGATGDVIGTISRKRTMDITFSCALQLGQRLRSEKFTLLVRCIVKGRLFCSRRLFLF